MYFNKWQANMAASESNPGSSFSLARGYCPISWLMCELMRFRSDLFTTFHADTPGVERFVQILSSRCSRLGAKAANLSVLFHSW